MKKFKTFDYQQATQLRIAGIDCIVTARNDRELKKIFDYIYRDSESTYEYEFDANICRSIKLIADRESQILYLLGFDNHNIQSDNIGITNILKPLGDFPIIPIRM